MQRTFLRVGSALVISVLAVATAACQGATPPIVGIPTDHLPSNTPTATSAPPTGSPTAAGPPPTATSRPELLYADLLPGSYLAYCSYAPDDTTPALSAISLDGMHVGRLMTDACDASYRRQTREIAVSRDYLCPDGYSALVVRNFDTGQERVVDGSCGLSGPSWSPDGKWLLASSADAQVMAIPSEGGLTIPVSSPNEEASSPQWSPDGKYIAYTITFAPYPVAGSLRLVEASCITSANCTSLPHSGLDVTAPYAFSPSGREIVAWQGPFDETGSLMIVDLQSLELRRLQVNHDRAVPPPSLAWATDGQALALTYEPSGGQAPIIRLSILDGAVQVIKNTYSYDSKVLQFWFEVSN